MLLPTLGTVCRVECTVGLDEFLSLDLCHAFQGVNVLSVVTEKETFLLQQLDEVVTRGGIEVAGVELLREKEKVP